MPFEHTELLKVRHIDVKYRLGSNTDGGYVLAELANGYDCYISCGISNEESFSRDFINKYQMDEYNSFGFDGTIDRYPYEYTNKISFIKKNIGGLNDDKHTNLSALLERFSNIFLKMDIEGGEYTWLLSIDESRLKKFKQIVIEFHGITGDGWGCNYNGKIQCLDKLANTHYLVHAHGNNYGSTVNGIPDVIELTYVCKSYFASEPEFNTMPLPIPGIDFPNKYGYHDFDLNFYPFKGTKVKRPSDATLALKMRVNPL